MPYFFEDGYENLQYDYFYDNTHFLVNAAGMVEIMEEMLDLFKNYTCVEFLRLRTEEEKNQYDYKIKIVHDEYNNGTCGAWSRLGTTEKPRLFSFYFKEDCLTKISLSH